MLVLLAEKMPNTNLTGTVGNEEWKLPSIASLATIRRGAQARAVSGRALAPSAATVPLTVIAEEKRTAADGEVVVYSLEDRSVPQDVILRASKADQLAIQLSEGSKLRLTLRFG